jgi:disulfide bond formation protein DsbB
VTKSNAIAGESLGPAPISRHIEAMTAVFDLLLRRWPLLALAASAAMLAAAHAFQTFGGFAPCTLCLRQREVYWLAFCVAGAAAVISRTRVGPVAAPWIGAALTLIFLTGAYIAAYHAGAEWKWWPGPTTCSASGAAASAADLSRLLAGGRIRPPSCDVAAWRMLGLSMAGWNVLVSLALAGLSGGWALHARRGDRS